MSQNPRLSVQGDKIALALLAGTGVAAVLSGSLVIGSLFAGNPFHNLPLLALGVGIAWIVWAFGVALIGGPAWVLLRRIGWDNVFAAVCVGALAPAAGILAATALGDLVGSGTTESSVGGVVMVRNGVQTAAGWAEVLLIGLALGIPGALAGLIIWRIAYRRARP